MSTQLEIRVSIPRAHTVGYIKLYTTVEKSLGIDSDAWRELSPDCRKELIGEWVKNQMQLSVIEVAPA